uniref:Putative tick ixostatin n=1 Tax=Ixodes ricinus TaxID=34613 RepID=V5GHX4_IXORI
MQLTLFIVIVTFAAHLSCEVQSESIPDFPEKMKDLSQKCKETMKKQILDKCHRNSYQPELRWVTECKINCGYENNDGYLKMTSGQTYNLENGTPCGHSRECINGECVEICNLDFM